MKRGLFLILIALSGSLPVQARVGESLQQCVDRYGPVMEKRASTVAGSEPESVVFSRSSITIIAELHEGVVWKISFRKEALTPGEVEAILQANGTGLWSVPLKINEQDYRISSDKKRLLTMIADKKGVTGEMIIMTRECAAAIKTGLQLKMNEPRPLQMTKPASNPLPGF